MEAIGQNLRRLRGARGLTQGNLAEAAGLSRPGYRAIENGESVPRAPQASRAVRIRRLSSF